MLIRRAMGDAWTDHELFEKVKADYDRHYAVHCNDHTAAYDGCAEMLEKLAKKGVKTGVLSNKPDEFVDKMLKKAFPNLLRHGGRNHSTRQSPCLMLCLHSSI